jgi:hypothetical protein
MENDTQTNNERSLLASLFTAAYQVRAFIILSRVTVTELGNARTIRRSEQRGRPVPLNRR